MMGRKAKKAAKRKLEGSDDVQAKEMKKAQGDLAGAIKGLHWKLRKQFRQNKDGLEEMWKQHSNDINSLRQYAQAMHTLATQHWDAHGDTRIHWCRNTALAYFKGDGLRLALEKDARRRAFEMAKLQDNLESSKMGAPADQSSTSSKETTESLIHGDDSDSSDISHPFPDRVRLLDVGSCYNPFLEHREFVPLAIDLCPATLTVAQCDFLQLEVTYDPVGLDLALALIKNLSTRASTQSVEPIRYTCQTTQSQQEPREELNEQGETSQKGPNLDSCQHPQSAQESNKEIDDETEQCIKVPNQETSQLQERQQEPNYKEEQGEAIRKEPNHKTCQQERNLNEELVVQRHIGTGTNLDSTIRLTGLPARGFHCVVFSLLLEYLPSCDQRLVCCVKAHRLLSLNGLLIVVTPDSHSLHRNAPMMKSWKEAIEAIGFRRCKYEKLCHLHGMAYRKITREPQVSATDQTVSSKLYIPQDFKDEPDMKPPPKKRKVKVAQQQQVTDQQENNAS